MAKYGQDAAREDLQRIKKFENIIQEAAALYDVSPAILAGILSRETRGNPNLFIGDGGHGCGPMQIDDRSFPEVCAKYKAKQIDDACMIRFGARVLQMKLSELSRHVQASEPGLIRAAVAAYNCGSGNVMRALRAGMDVDKNTTGQNYSADVMERAAFFESELFTNF